MLVAKFNVVRFTKNVGVPIVVESEAEAGADPPPDTFAWLIWGEVAFPATFTVKVMGL